MATPIIIGRKELFAFADRYSSHRLREYAGLADGDVVCRLFSLVFPHYAIRPVDPQTRSPTQRTLHNWEALFRGFARLHIPLSLLDPLALARNDAEKGFSTLVLLYFLYHLSKKADFTAEFALDVSEELTAFLQSIESIASLLLGEAMDWEAIPEELGDVIRDLPSFHVTPEEQEALEEAAARQCRSILAPPPSSHTSVNSAGGSARRRVSAHKGGHQLTPAVQPSGRTQTPTVVSLTSPQRTDQAEPVPSPAGVSSRSVGKSPGRVLSAEPSLNGSAVEEKGRTGQRAPSIDDQSVASSVETSTATLDGVSVAHTTKTPQRVELNSEANVRLQDLQRRFVEKAKECETLRGGNVELLAQRASLEADLAYAGEKRRQAEERAEELEQAVESLVKELEAAHAQLANVAEQSSRTVASEGAAASAGAPTPPRTELSEETVDALLGEVADPATGAPIDAHENANLLHCMLLEHMHKSPINRGQAQSWLWAIVTAYHVLEERLVTAVDLIDAQQQQLKRALADKADGEANWPQAFVEKMNQQHRIEHALRQELAQRGALVQRTAALAEERDGAWRRLCVALQRSGQLAMEVADCDTEDVVRLDTLLEERDACLREVDVRSEELTGLKGLPAEDDVSERAAALDSACVAVELIAEEALRERDALAQDLAALRRAYDAVQATAARSGSHLTTPPHSAQAAPNDRDRPSSGPKTRPAAVAAAKVSLTPPSAKRQSPYGKNLASLLAEATSPFERLASGGIGS